MSYGSVKWMYYMVELQFRSIILEVYAEMHTRFDGKRGLPLCLMIPQEGLVKPALLYYGNLSYIEHFLHATLL